jgi:hypothetical protein
MDMNTILALVATAIMFTFAAIVLYQFWRKRHVYNLLWGIGLLMFGVGTFAEAYLAQTWHSGLFRLWYLFGAMLTAGWLGQGSLALMVRRPWVRYLTLVLLVLSLMGAVVMATIPIDASAYSAGQSISMQYKDILPKSGVRLLTPLFNVYGTVFLVGAAVYSAYLYWRKQTSSNRVAGNLLIAAGALVIAAAGTITRLFLGGMMPIAELTSAVLMFSGFMLAAAPAPVLAPGSKRAPHAA